MSSKLFHNFKERQKTKRKLQKLKWTICNSNMTQFPENYMKFEKKVFWCIGRWGPKSLQWSDSSNVITIRFYLGCSGKCITLVSTVSSLVTFKTTSLNWMPLVMRQLILVWRIFRSNPRHLMVIIQCLCLKIKTFSRSVYFLPVLAVYGKSHHKRSSLEYLHSLMIWVKIW